MNKKSQKKSQEQKNYIIVDSTGLNKESKKNYEQKISKKISRTKELHHCGLYWIKYNNEWVIAQWHSDVKAFIKYNRSRMLEDDKIIVGDRIEKPSENKCQKKK
jgi:hypothetical protein